MKEKEKVLFDFWESPSPFFFRRVRARTSHIAAARTGLVTARVRHALCGLSALFWHMLFLDPFSQQSQLYQFQLFQFLRFS